MYITKNTETKLIINKKKQKFKIAYAWTVARIYIIWAIHIQYIYMNILYMGYNIR